MAMRLVALISVALCVSNALLAAEHGSYTEERLFTVEYGWEPEKVGNYMHMLEPSLEAGKPLLSSLTVDSRGHIWLGEATNCVVKEFSREGAFIRGVGRRSLRPWEGAYQGGELPKEYRRAPWAFVTRLLDFAIGTRGRAFLLVDPDTRALVFDREGMPVLSDGWSDVIVQIRGWEKICHQLRQETGVVWPAIVDVNCDLDDDLYVVVRDEPVDQEDTGTTRIAKFDDQLQFLGWRSGRYVSPAGKTYQFAERDQMSVSATVQEFGPDGKLARGVELVPPEDGTAREYSSAEHMWARPDGLLVDARGRFYLVFSNPRLATTDAGKWNKAHAAVSIYAFEADGTFMSEIRLPYVAKTSTSPCVAVDRVGNVYYAVYGQKGIEVRCQTH